MHSSLLLIALFTLGQQDQVGAGNHKRTLTVDDMKRVHWIHVPPKYDAKKPTPVILALHGATMDAKTMELFTGLNETADKYNFIVVYPNGTGPAGLLQTWNAGLFPGELSKTRVDDVKYLGKVLDDVESACNVDKKRIYVAGLSNGGMMSYRLASEMSERIAAIVPVAGTMAIEKYEPKRPVPVCHIHGTKDSLVPYGGPSNAKEIPKFLKFLGVEDTILRCIKANGCDADPKVVEIEMKSDKMKVVRKTYANGKASSEVVLYVLEDGGHVWPGGLLNPAFLGKSTNNILTNEVIWDFCQRHSLK